MTDNIVTGQLGIRGLLLRTGVVVTGQLGLRDTLFRTGIVVTGQVASSQDRYHRHRTASY